jgi:glutaredoxin 3
VAVEIYTREFCGFCEAAKRLLGRKRIDFVEIDITGNRERRAEMTARAGGQTTVPQIFVNSRHLGDCEALYDLERRGELDAWLSGAPEAKVHG